MWASRRKIFACTLYLIVVAIIFPSMTCFHLGRYRRLCHFSIYCEDNSINDLTASMAAARKNQKQLSSPGAGLDAFESADAAYADLINTSIDQRNITLSDEQLRALEKGGSMWESGAITQTREQSGGILGDLRSTLGALFGGAQIEKNKYGET